MNDFLRDETGFLQYKIQRRPRFASYSVETRGGTWSGGNGGRFCLEPGIYRVAGIS